MTSAEQVTKPVAYHAEGPVWFESVSQLRWVDMFDGSVLTLDADGTVGRQNLSTSVVAAIRPRAQGGCVLALERGFAIQPDLSEPSLTELPRVITRPSTRMNEGACDPDGRFYCGSMAYDAAPHRGSLYRLNTDRSVDVIADGLTISNGLDWAPDGGLAYYADTATGGIDVFDYDSAGGLTDRRRFVTIDERLGAPDGLTVDSEGHVWVALWGGAAVRRYRPDGTLDGIVDLPVRNVTACTLGGPRRDVLFMTTSRVDTEIGAEPLAGALFRVRVGVPGQPVRNYLG